MTLATGQILNNRYRIVSLLGQGSFGAVYRAWDSPVQELTVSNRRGDAPGYTSSHNGFRCARNP